MNEFIKQTEASIDGRSVQFRRLILTAALILVVGILTYYALFQLPFYFPPRQRLWSASHAFGFNNSVAILAMASLLGLTTVLRLVRQGAPAGSINFSLQETNLSDRSFVTALVVMVLVYIGLTFSLYVYFEQSSSWLMWEARHFLYRAQLMELYHLQPYTGFQAEYGLLLTSTPVYLHLGLKPFGVSLEQAYFIDHFLLNFAGLYCIYYVLACARISPTTRTTAFVVLGIAGFAPYMGLNGILLRYLAPFACLVFGHRRFMRTSSLSKGPKWWLGATLTVLIMSLINLLQSPETIVAFSLAWLGYCVLTIRRDIRLLLVSLFAFVAAGVFCWLFLPEAYYDSVLRFSEGANNLPLVPVPHLLLYVITMFLVVPPLLSTALKGFVSSEVAGAAICGALGILCVVTMPGAFGRCDPPHVLFFGLGASMLLMIRLATLSCAFFTSYVTIYATVFIGLMQLTNLHVFFKAKPSELFSDHGMKYLKAQLPSASGTEQLDEITLHKLDSYPRLGLPYATFGDPVVENYVLQRKQLNPEYYLGVVGVYTPAALDRKLLEVAKMEYLLVPKYFGPEAPPDLCDKYLQRMDEWFFYRGSLRCREDSMDPVGTLNSFMAEHYKVVDRVGSWAVLRRR